MEQKDYLDLVQSYATYYNCGYIIFSSIYLTSNSVKSL
jgi:hypothetical protein